MSRGGDHKGQIRDRLRWRAEQYKRTIGFSNGRREHDDIMLIPCEDRLVRIYCQLSEVKPGSDGRFYRSGMTPDMILKVSQKIMSSYKLTYKHCDWWTVYHCACSWR